MIVAVGAPGGAARVLVRVNELSEADIQKNAGEVSIEVPQLGEWVISQSGLSAQLKPADLNYLIAMATARIDVEAEAARSEVLTIGAGQAMTYMKKELEAQALLANPSAYAPMLTTEAEALDVPLLDLAAEVAAAAEIWETVGARIEAARRKTKIDLALCQTEAEVEATVDVDWFQVISGPSS